MSNSIDTASSGKLITDYRQRRVTSIHRSTRVF